MKYTEIRQYNVGGNRQVTIPGGPVVVISGDNGTGKTSLIEGISLLFDGGHNVDLIGPFDEKAVVEIDFDNGWKFRRTTTAKSYTLEGWSDDGTPIKKPAETLKKLVSGLSLNPAGLVDAPQKDRLKFLQGAMPLAFTTVEIAEALSTDGSAVTLPVGPLDAQGFNAYRDGYYAKRTELNRSGRDKEGTRNTLIKSLPTEDDIDWAEKASGLRIEQQAINKKIAENNLTVEKIRSEEVGRLTAEAQAMIDSIKNGLAKSIAIVDSEAAEQSAIEQLPLTERLTAIVAAIATAEERSRQQQQAKGVRESIERISKEEKILSTQANQLDRVIEKLDNLKKKKLDALPIPGVEIRDGQIYYNGLNFDTQLNTAQQYVLSFQVAALTLGDLPLMLFDGAEALGETAKNEFIEGIRDAGFQVILAEVRSNEPLVVSAV